MLTPPRNGGSNQFVTVSGLQFQCQSRSLVECRSAVSPLVHQAECGLDVRFAFQVDDNGGKSPRISRHFNASVAQLVRARPCHGRGCGFEFHLMLQFQFGRKCEWSRVVATARTSALATQVPNGILDRGLEALHSPACGYRGRAV